MDSKANSPRRNHHLNLRRVQRLFRMATAKQVCPLCGGEIWQKVCLECNCIPEQDTQHVLNEA